MKPRNLKLPSVWQWTFKNKWYYICVVIWLIVNGSLFNFMRGNILLAEIIGMMIAGAFVVMILFLIAYRVYKAGFNKSKI